ncbi:GFA family protein [Stappia sp. MMSF_3263]|uniref:GFA family protein n=1 Tax=Stappia sp. MMSF_3263 TaxID=3046693 RepID=UPI00273FA5C4|nr:hypothetical protein [Stappia sp. MMSF_3263]
MSEARPQARAVNCRCGAVALEVTGSPIITTACQCSSCRKAGRLLEALPGAAPVLDAEGGTPCMLYRKDRVRCERGAVHLREHRLDPGSPTRRVVATCCNTAMFLDFTKGHWLTIYRDRVENAGAGESGHRRSSLAFVLRLLAAWAAMGFRTPEITFVGGRLNGAES